MLLPPKGPFSLNAIVIVFFFSLRQIANNVRTPIYEKLC